jgi:hypothetical protein
LSVRPGRLRAIVDHLRGKNREREQFFFLLPFLPLFGHVSKRNCRLPGSKDQYVVTVPVSPQGVLLEDDALLLRRDLASLEVGPQVVHPPKPAALAASLQSCGAQRDSVRPPTHYGVVCRISLQAGSNEQCIYINNLNLFLSTRRFDHITNLQT